MAQKDKTNPSYKVLRKKRAEGEKRGVRKSRWTRKQAHKSVTTRKFPAPYWEKKPKKKRRAPAQNIQPKNDRIASREGAKKRKMGRRLAVFLSRIGQEEKTHDAGLSAQVQLKERTQEVT